MSRHSPRGHRLTRAQQHEAAIGLISLISLIAFVRLIIYLF